MERMPSRHTVVLVVTVRFCSLDRDKVERCRISQVSLISIGQLNVKEIWMTMQFTYVVRYRKLHKEMA